jgi:hypothetical protein
MDGKSLATGIFLLSCFLISSCASVYHPAADEQGPANRVIAEKYREKVSALQTDLAGLNGHLDHDEAARVAETAISYSAELAAEYRLIRPAALHNLFVRMGFRDRGLCYQWTEDLLRKLQTLNLKTYQLYWAVAHRGSELREHNSVVITARGQPFEDGIVLDPWRNSGDLYWSKINSDRYPWRELPPSEW